MASAVLGAALSPVRIGRGGAVTLIGPRPGCWATTAATTAGIDPCLQSGMTDIKSPTVTFYCNF
jgi:hypothetical protein